MMDRTAGEPLDVRLPEVRRMIEEGAGFDGDTAFEVLNPIVDDCHREGRFDAVVSLLDLVERRHPAVARKEFALFCTWRVQNALLRPGGDPRPALLAFAEQPMDNIEAFIGLLEWLRYAGRAEDLAATLERAWPAILAGADELVPEALDELREMAVMNALGRRLDADPDLRGDEAGVVAVVQVFGEFETARLEETVAHLTGRATCGWTTADFEHEDEGRRADRLRLLSLDFTLGLIARNGWSRTRAELARCAVAECLLGRRERSAQGRKNGGKRKPASPLLPAGARFLVPDAASLDDWLTGMVESLGAGPHGAAALAPPSPVDRLLVERDSWRSGRALGLTSIGPPRKRRPPWRSYGRPATRRRCQAFLGVDRPRPATCRPWSRTSRRAGLPRRRPDVMPTVCQLGNSKLVY